MERVRQHGFADISAADDIAAPEIRSQEVVRIVRSSGECHLDTLGKSQLIEYWSDQRCATQVSTNAALS